MDDAAFHSLWGTEGLPPAKKDDSTPTRTLDPSDFGKWLVDKYDPDNTYKQNTDTAASTINAATGNAIDAIPIAGPYIKAGTEKLAARIRATMYGTSVDDELANIRDYQKKSTAAHPVAATSGTVGGAVYPYLVGAGLAPKAFGLSGNLAERTVYGATTNAALNAADTATRGGTLKDIERNALTGGVFGGGLPLVGRGLGAAGSALLASQDASTNALLAKADKFGIPIYFSQQTSSPFVAKASQMAGKLPGSGMSGLVDAQQGSFNRAVARTFGEDAERITPDVMAKAKTRLGSEFDAVAAGTTVKADSQFLHDVHGVLKDADSTLVDSEMKVLHKQVGNILDKITGAGEIEGDAYQALTRKGTPLDRAMQSSDPNVKHYASQIRNVLDDALERSAPPDLLGRLKSARGQYKNMKTIEDLVEKSHSGDISGPSLMGAVRNSYGNMAYGGGGELADLARIGQRFMRQPPDSGTPLGEAALKLVTLGAAGAGGALYAGHESGYDPIEMLKGAALLPVSALSARAATQILNKPQALNALISRQAPALVPAYNQLTSERQQ